MTTPNTQNLAHIIDYKGDIALVGFVSLQRGCHATQNFARLSGQCVPYNGVSFVIGENPTKEAIQKAIEILQSHI